MKTFWVYDGTKLIAEIYADSTCVVERAICFSDNGKTIAYIPQKYIVVEANANIKIHR